MYGCETAFIRSKIKFNTGDRVKLNTNIGVLNDNNINELSVVRGTYGTVKRMDNNEIYIEFDTGALIPFDLYGIGEKLSIDNKLSL